MSDKFKVRRQHLGDRMYMPGMTREVAAGTVKHLVANGVLEPMKEKAEAAPKNKAEPKAANKKA
jgi:hypothetical protein